MYIYILYIIYVYIYVLRYIYCMLRLGSERGCIYIYVYVCMLRYIYIVYSDTGASTGAHYAPLCSTTSALLSMPARSCLPRIHI